jgi:hypothetical protein
LRRRCDCRWCLSTRRRWSRYQNLRPGNCAVSVEDASVFLKIAEQHRLGALFSVALACGLRLGEATGLLWDVVEVETGEVHVRQQLQVVNKQLVLQSLKTAKRRRTLVLPQVCIKALRAHGTRQLEERLKAGSRWVDTAWCSRRTGRIAQRRAPKGRCGTSPAQCHACTGGTSGCRRTETPTGAVSRLAAFSRVVADRGGRRARRSVDAPWAFRASRDR